ncbi:prepilin-type N-terminal cleavage/methylation domain-containing protein, partial [bacterium]|nr:prepilin-type N-terminal cleavage/methylation domain-containing protein [bacterium]
MKKNGFTLIELLAVIVILAIIALIATPTILGVIEKAKKGSFKNSVYGLIDSANLYVAEHLESSSLTFTCDGKSCSSKDGGKLSFKGSVPKSGNIIVDSKQKVSVEIITDGTYCATGT